MGDRRQNFYLTALLMASCAVCDTAEEATDLAMETLENLGLLSDDTMESAAAPNRRDAINRVSTIKRTDIF